MNIENIEKKCAFCDGEGLDPFGILSPLSICQVCGGKGKIMVSEPVIACAFCGGSGIYPSRRLTCTACGGKGKVTMEEPRETCKACGGSGRSRINSALPCGACGGKGMINQRRDNRRQRTENLTSDL